MTGCAVDAYSFEGFIEDIVRADSIYVLLWIVCGGEEPGGWGAELVQVVQGFLVGLDWFTEFWLQALGGSWGGELIVNEISLLFTWLALA